MIEIGGEINPSQKRNEIPLFANSLGDLWRTERERESDRQKDKDRDRQMETDTNTQIARQKDRQTQKERNIDRQAFINIRTIRNRDEDVQTDGQSDKHTRRKKQTWTDKGRIQDREWRRRQTKSVHELLTHRARAGIS